MAQTKPATPKRAPRTLAGKVSHEDASRTQALKQYQEALRLMQESKFDKAHALFTKMLEAAPADLAERVRMYLNACAQQINQHKNTFNSLEEQYDYAISLLNTGNYDDARAHLQTILKKDGKADYAFYGLAVLASMTGETENCLQQLTEAISLNGRNRIQARSDSDFQDMADDPRFTELLYPE